MTAFNNLLRYERQKAGPYALSTYYAIILIVSLAALIFLCESMYDKIEQLKSTGKPIVFGIVESSHYVSGKGSHIETTIRFNASAHSTYKCIVDASFNSLDAGLQKAATIRVALSDEYCGMPWFPDHIESPVIPLVLCAICSCVAGVMYLWRRMRRHPASGT